MSLQFDQQENRGMQIVGAASASDLGLTKTDTQGGRSTQDAPMSAMRTRLPFIGVFSPFRSSPG